jgi:NAD(P)-dependent dehydrogenase (short-subunit alcohol dehydrogenase family)
MHPLRAADELDHLAASPGECLGDLHATGAAADNAPVLAGIRHTMIPARRVKRRNLGTNDLEPARQQALTRIPIGRMGTVSDIAKGIVFLASDDAGFMTGAGLVVDGGSTAQ